MRQVLQERKEAAEAKTTAGDEKIGQDNEKETDDMENLLMALGSDQEDLEIFRN